MTLQDVYDYLLTGELSQVFMGEKDDFDCVSAESLKKLWSSVDLALTALYTRFLLEEKTLTLELTEAQRRYLIDVRYAKSNTDSDAPVKYIADLDMPYQSDLLRIEQVFDPEGEEQTLNVENEPCAFMTPNHRTLVVPTDYTEDSVTLHYRANHPKVERNLAESSPDLVEIELPTTHLQALMYYVAARTVTPVGMTSEFHDGNNYWALYENTCAGLEARNFTVDLERSTANRFKQNGWV